MSSGDVGGEVLGDMFFVVGKFFGGRRRTS
jgi:hypothetical protein